MDDMEKIVSMTIKVSVFLNLGSGDILKRVKPLDEKLHGLVMVKYLVVCESIYDLINLI